MSRRSTAENQKIPQSYQEIDRKCEIWYVTVAFTWVCHWKSRAYAILHNKFRQGLARDTHTKFNFLVLQFISQESAADFTFTTHVRGNAWFSQTRQIYGGGADGKSLILEIFHETHIGWMAAAHTTQPHTYSFRQWCGRRLRLNLIFSLLCVLRRRRRRVACRKWRSGLTNTQQFASFHFREWSKVPQLCASSIPNVWSHCWTIRTTYSVCVCMYRGNRCCVHVYDGIGKQKECVGFAILCYLRCTTHFYDFFRNCRTVDKGNSYCINNIKEKSTGGILWIWIEISSAHAEVCLNHLLMILVFLGIFLLGNKKIRKKIFCRESSPL